MKAGAMEKMLHTPGAVAQTKARLTARGAEVLAPTNAYEVLRIRTSYGVGVVYRNEAGRMSPNEAATRALRFIHQGEKGSLAPVKVTKRRVRGGARAGEVEEILRRDGDDCFYCAITFAEREEITIEHLVPRAHGGPDHISNKFLACGPCNSIAGHLSAPEKIRIRDRVRGHINLEGAIT